MGGRHEEAILFLEKTLTDWNNSNNLACKNFFQKKKSKKQLKKIKKKIKKTIKQATFFGTGFCICWKPLDLKMRLNCMTKKFQRE